MQSFFQYVSFAEADRLTVATNKQFIADLMPRNPIYVKLLSFEAQSVLGKPHPTTIPAMNILLKEGFRYHNYIDIFDAGPTLEAPLPEINTIKSSRIVTIKSIRVKKKTCDEYILSNRQLQFRATIKGFALMEQNNTCIINSETAELLYKLKSEILLSALPLYTPIKYPGKKRMSELNIMQGKGQYIGGAMDKKQRFRTGISQPGLWHSALARIKSH